MFIFDNHLHLRFKGRNVEAIKEFEKHGGTHFVLVRYPSKILKEEDFRDNYEETLRMAKHVRKNTGVKVFVALGPYPAEILNLEKNSNLEEAVNVMKRGVDLAAWYITEGKAITIGEVGRPHFPVEERIWKASNDVLTYVMSVAKDVGCPAMLHTESSTTETFKELAMMADKVGIRRDKVIQHFSPPIIDEEKNKGLFPSIIASEKNIREALRQGTRFMLESDYLDDLKRPGAVIAPSTIPRKTKNLLRSGAMSEEAAFKIHKENPEKVYGIRIE